MIDAFSEKTRELFPELRGPVQFLKLNTPGSLKGKYQKVIFLAFEQGKGNPFLCFKTVRSKEHNPTVIHAFENLQKFARPVQGTSFEKYIPKPFGLFDFDGIAYSVESALNGRRPRISDLPNIIEQYIEFQKAGQAKGFLQHGDLTFDNILLENDALRMYDCDRSGSIDVPGFDLYYLLSRMPGKIDDYKPYFERYFSALGSKKTLAELLPEFEAVERKIKK